MAMHICGPAAILHGDPLSFGQGASFEHFAKNVFLSMSPYPLVERSWSQADFYCHSGYAATYFVAMQRYLSFNAFQLVAPSFWALFGPAQPAWLRPILIGFVLLHGPPMRCF